MAARKKEDMPNMIETFKEFKDTKKIDRATLVSVLEAVSYTHLTLPTNSLV